MGNSSLVNYTKISPNRTSPRNRTIDTITIHCVVGQCSVETLGAIFAPTSREASSNYGIGYDGRIGMYCEEKDRSWCTSSAANDNRAITIEVASDTIEPYAVNEKAYAALLDLVTDICKRNEIKKIVWSENKSDRINHANGCNMTVHRDYANKSCPGNYLYNRQAEIAAEVNKRLGAAAEQPKLDAAIAGTLYKVQIGAFSKKANATALEKKVKAAGFDTFVAKEGTLYKVQVGAFSVKANAEAMQKKLSAAGYADAFITTSSGTAATPSAPAVQITEGSRVRLKRGAPTYTGGSLASYVYDRVHVVKEISGKRAVITFGNIVVAAVNVDDLTLAQ